MDSQCIRLVLKQAVLASSVSVFVTASAILLTVPAGAKGLERVLYSFCAQFYCKDGTSPAGGLLADSAGNLYGVTQGGGLNTNGTVFMLTPERTETVLYSFCSLSNCADGSAPNTGVIPIIDGDGNLYGTTEGGGSTKCEFGCGTVWRVALDGSETVLHTFTGGKDGDYPLTGLVSDASGNLYGTTLGGGRGNCLWSQNNLTVTGCGTVFKIATDHTFSTLYRFEGGSDGANPVGTLIIDRNGNLYGTTLAGGAGDCSLLETSGCGTVFKIATDHTFSTLYRFGGGSDGANPVDFGGLLLDKQDSIYGTTYDGGTFNYGTVFELTKDGVESVQYRFTGGTDGAYPWSGLISDKRSNLYGTTQAGGNNGSGVVFKIAPGGREKVLYNFCSKENCTDGSSPLGKLLADKKFRHLYSTTPSGGANGGGTVFSIGLNAASDGR